MTPEWVRQAVERDGLPVVVDTGEELLVDLAAVSAWLRRPDPHGDET